MSRISRNARGLHELLNYRMGRLVSTASQPVVRLCEGSYGVSRREWGLLAVLGQEGELSPSALATHMGLDRARTSRVLQQLVRKHLVERRLLPGDRRQARVRLTTAGRDLYDALLPEVAEVNRQVLQVLTDAELEVLDELVVRLLARARQLGEHSEGPRARRHLGGGRSHSEHSRD